MPPGSSGGKPAFIHSKLDDAGLDVYEFRIYGRIARRGECCESVAGMAEGCGISPRQTHRAIAGLSDRRMIEREARPGQPSIYRLTDPSEWVGPLPHRQTPSASQAEVDDPDLCLTGRPPLPGGQTPSASQADPIYKGSPSKVIQEGTPQKEARAGTEPFWPDLSEELSEEPSPGLQKVPSSDEADTSDDPVEIYKQITGNECALYFQELIRKDVGTDPEALIFWGAVCEVWRDTEKWNDRQVRKMLDDFKSQLERSKKTNGRTGPNGESRKEAFDRIGRATGSA